jgi:hypothetical protein
MARLYLFAEGPTEQTFADVVLGAHLSRFGIYVHTIVIAHAFKKHQVHRGGGRKYTPVRKDIQRQMKQDDHPDVYFTTMIDFYAIHADFPGRDEVENAPQLPPPDRVKILEDSFGRDINHPRFIPFIQLHEFEAYLFCRPAEFSLYYPNQSRAIAELEAIANQYNTPEEINDGQHTAPSKRIIAHLPEYKSAKRVQGPEVAELIGLSTIRSKCPHFDAWLTRLEGLGGSQA